MHRRPVLHRVLCLVAAAATLGLPSAALLWHAAPARAEEKVKKSELNNRMEDIDELMKKLRRSVRKAESNEESLKLIADIEKLMVEGKSLVPTKAEKVPEAERAKFVQNYRKEMAGVIIVFCEMEQAILDGDNKKATDLYKTITEREDKDHDQFMQKEEKDKK